MKRAVVLLSGGLDSVTALAMAREQGFECYTLSFNYGQRHHAELNAAKSLSGQNGAVAHKFIDIDLSAIGGSALTDQSIALPEHYEEAIPVTYVPARNTVFLSIALGWAEVLSAQAIFVGVNAVDYSGYPDCRPEFLSAMNAVAQTCHTFPIRVEAPFLNLTKAEIIKTGIELGVDYSKTWTCYEGKELACGQCGSCNERLEAFALNDSTDPLLYKN